MNDMVFPEGLIAKAPHENAPDFVKCKLSIVRKDLGNWLRAQEGDWINLDVKVSKNGKWYVAVDTWKPDAQAPSQQPSLTGPPPEDFDDDDIPF